MHHLKRFYLLGALGLSLLIPQLTITEYVEPIVSEIETSAIFIPAEGTALTEIPVEQPPLINLETTLWLIYGIGAFIFLLRFIINLVRLYRLISKNENITKSNFIYVLLREYRIPHSFFNYIFLNKLKFENHEIPKEVLLHEETHAKQLHSLDILVIEVLQIVFWFHPLVYVLKHHIKLNHEFLADQAVLNQGIDTSNYQQILLQFSSNTKEHQLYSAINYSSFKKRFTVMKTQTSKTRIWVSSLLLLPIIAILFYSFAEKEYVEKDFTLLTETTDSNLFLVTVEKNGNTIELKCESGCRWSHLVLKPSSEPYIINDFGFSEGNTIDRDKFTFSISTNNNGVALNGLKGTAWIDLAFSLSENKKQAINQLGMTNHWSTPSQEINNDLQKRAETNYYIKQFFTVKNEDEQYVKKRFFELDYDNKIKWVYANEIPYTTIDVTEQHFEEAKNSKNLIIKVNGNYISKDDLNEYKASDFITFSYTPISELAEMKEQSVLNLVTHDAYYLFVRLMIEHYSEVFKDYENKIALSEKERKTDIKELVSTYEFLRYNYKKFTPEIIEKHNFKPPTAISEEIIAVVNQSYLDIPNLYIDEKNNLFLNNKPTSIVTLREDFNALTGNKKSELILEAGGRKVHNNFVNKIMTSIGENLITIVVPNGQALIFDPNYKSKESQQDQKAYNPTFLEYIIEMENEGATFFLDDKKISTEKAKSIAKNNKGNKTEMLTQKDADGNYIVKLSPSKTIQQQVTKEELAAYNSWATKIHSESKKLSNDATWYPPINEHDLIKHSGIYKRMSAIQKKQSVEYPFLGMEIDGTEKSITLSNQQKATKKQIVEYNAWAKKLNTDIKKARANKSSESPIIKQKEVERYLHIYKNIMTDEQRKNAEPFPNIPPPPPPPPSPETTEVIDHGNTSEPPPPAPEPALDFVIRMAKANAKFFNEGKSISSDKAIALLKKNPNLNINAQKTDTKQPLVYISQKPMLIGVKGKLREPIAKQELPAIYINKKRLDKAKVVLTINELKQLKLTLSKGEVIRFKLKIPGIKTDVIEGNSISKTSIKNLENFKKGIITLFDIKDNSDNRLQPVIIELKE